LLRTSRQVVAKYIAPPGLVLISNQSGARGDSTRDHFRDNAGYWPMSARLRVSASASSCPNPVATIHSPMGL